MYSLSLPEGEEKKETTKKMPFFCLKCFLLKADNKQRFTSWIQFIAGLWKKGEKEKGRVQRTRDAGRRRGKKLTGGYRVKQYTIHKAGGGNLMSR